MSPQVLCAQTFAHAHTMRMAITIWVSNDEKKKNEEKKTLKMAVNKKKSSLELRK